MMQVVGGAVRCTLPYHSYMVLNGFVDIDLNIRVAEIVDYIYYECLAFEDI